MSADYRSNPFRVGLDVDGVVADFVRGFLGLLEDITERRVPSDYVQTTWSQWHDYKPSEVSKAWDTINADPRWWQRLQPLGHDREVARFLSRLSTLPAGQVAVTFITTRTSDNAYQQTAQWLMAQGWVGTPQVFVARNSHQKAQLSFALGLDLFVDDFWSNLQAVELHHPPCQTVLYRQPYNDPYEPCFKCAVSLEHVLQLITQGAEDKAAGKRGERLPSFTDRQSDPQAR